MFNIEEFTTSSHYDSPEQPEAKWTKFNNFYGKTYKTFSGASRAISKFCKLTNRKNETFRIVAA